MDADRLTTSQMIDGYADMMDKALAMLELQAKIIEALLAAKEHSHD